MNAFDVVFCASLLCAGLALYRQRASTFLYAANQASVCRSLSLMLEHGRPPSLAFLPRWLFHRHNLEVAQIILAISAALLLAFVLIRPRTPPKEMPSLPPLPRPILAILFVYFAVLAFSMRSVVAVRYASEAQTVYWAPGGGLQALAAATLMYELYRRVGLGSLRPIVAFGIYFAVFVLTDYSKGQTGLASGFVFSAAILFFGAPGRIKRARAWMVGVVVFLAVIASVLRTARLYLYEDGLDAVETAVTKILQRESQKDERGEGMETAASGQEFAVLTLECITLYDSGLDREWASVYRTILYTLQPGFIMDLTKWKRPKEAAMEIREYFITNGGMAIYGESYWNGGYLGVVLILGGIIAICTAIDRSFRHGLVPLMLYCNFAPCLMQGVGYGISYEVRGVMNGFLALGAYYGWVFFRTNWIRLFTRARSAHTAIVVPLHRRNRSSAGVG